MPNIDISLQVPPLPAQWKGTADELFEFLSENAIFSVDGAFPAGQIGGARPTEDSGVWYGDYAIEKFRNGKYRTITDVPIGCVLPFAGTGGVPPENYLFCTGQSLVRVDYAELFEVLGAGYSKADDPTTTFRLPDYRGRVAVGSGLGDYSLQGTTGLMKEVVAGTYGGFEFATNENKASGAPKIATKMVTGTGLNAANSTITRVYPPHIGQQMIIRYR